MTTQQIEYVLALAEERNFSKAAEKLFVSQPALSQFIKNVEQQVGMPLFDRSTSPIQLTPAGEMYVETARQLQVTEKELERKIADLSDLATGHFRLGTSSFRASCLLPKSICEFNKRYPGIKLEIITNHVADLKQMLLSGEVDFCIEADDFNTSLFHVEELFCETYYLAVPPDHSINEGREENCLTKEDILGETKKLFTASPINLKEWEDETFIFMKNGSCFYNTYSKICENDKVNLTRIMEVNQIETAFHWVNEGLAVSFIPDSLIRYGNYDKHPSYYKLPIQSATRDIVAAMKKNRYVTHAMREYINVLRELIGYGTWNISD